MCFLAEGVVDPTARVRALKDISYSDWYLWEDEPEDAVQKDYFN